MLTLRKQAAQYFPLIVCVFVLHGTGLSETPLPQSVEIVIASDAAPQIQFGAQEISNALAGKTGTKPEIRRAAASSKGLTIFLGQKGDAVLPKMRMAIPADLESFSIAIPSKDSIIVAGSDATGAMYGALELAEQIAMAPGRDFADQLKPVSQSPFLELRGVNHFITVQDIDHAGGAFWSDAYWNGFLDMLARNRYNLLDLHGPVDAVNFAFPNGFSYFVSLPDFPQIGVGLERAKKNMERFRQVIKMAGDRGIKVAYMNYEAPPPLGPWQTREFGKDERWAPPMDPKVRHALSGPELEDYTRKAVTSFLKQLPQLWMFGFRIGESRQPEDFYKKTYLAALEEIPNDLHLYLRTWVADPARVRELATSTKRRLFVEPKYNGEQMGPPYQATLGGRDYAPSGSYETYTSYPRNFSILWQIRAHGTLRVFFWGSPEFARRTVRSCKFGDGVGFSMEPMDAYGPAADYLHNDPAVGHGFYPWMYQRQWLWHMVWGRTAYNPDVPEQVFRAEFVKRFGPEAGPRAYQAIVEASKIVPFIYSYHTTGLDHQEAASEFETGDHAMYADYPGAWVQHWTGDRLIPMGGDNMSFLSVQPIDRTAMADPATYVDMRLRNQASGKMTPWEASDFLDTAADAAEAANKGAIGHKPSNPEFDCLRRDIEALVGLSRYFADRIRSVTHLEFYNRTYDQGKLAVSYHDLRRAMEHWDQLSRAADGHFGYVPELLRMGVNRFRWEEEGRALAVDMDQINRMELDHARLSDSQGFHPRIGHVAPYKIKPGTPLVVNASVVGLAPRRRPNGVSLYYRNSQQTAYSELPMQMTNSYVDTWSATIPAQATIVGKLEYYFEVQPLLWNQANLTVNQANHYSVLVNDNDSKPEISHQEPAKGFRGSSVPLEIEVRSAAPARTANVYYKLMPSHHEWVKMEMKPAGDRRFRAEVPLTPVGILYYFEVVDDDGNGANFPNFLVRTPYFVVDSWDDRTH